jgi:hypothetical protein
MRTPRWLVCSAALAAFGFTQTLAEERPSVILAGTGWLASLDGSAHFCGYSCPFFDLGSDFGLDTEDWHPGVSVRVEQERHALLVDFSKGIHDSLDNTNQVTLGRFRLLYGFSALHRAPIDLGFVVGLDGYRVKTEAEPYYDNSLSAPGFLAVGIRLAVHPPSMPFEFNAMATVVHMELSHTDTDLKDLSAYIDVYLTPTSRRFGVRVGYARLDLNAVDTGAHDTGSVDYTFEGPMAGAVLKF